MGYYVYQNLINESNIQALAMTRKQHENLGLSLIHHSDRGL
jgi:hypothetical protein